MSILYTATPLVINPELASRIGLNESIILQQLNYWLNNELAGVEIDGRKWIHNSYESWKEQIPFLSARTIQRAFLRMEELGLIISCKPKQSRGDRTKFYTINYGHKLLKMSGREAEKPVVPDWHDHDDKLARPSCQSGTFSTETSDIPPNPQGGSAGAPDDHPAKTKPAKPKAIPFEQIKNLFNEILPEVPAVILLNKPRQAAIRARWNEHPVHQDLGFWTDLFNDIRKSDFLMGRVLSDRPFILTFDWLLRPSNFVKVVEGNYHG